MESQKLKDTESLLRSQWQELLFHLKAYDAAWLTTSFFLYFFPGISASDVNSLEPTPGKLTQD